jgi:hypothetical protein
MKTCAKCGGHLYEPGEMVLTANPLAFVPKGHKPGCPDGLVCQHDFLRRSCEICERDAEIALLRAAKPSHAALTAEAKELIRD